MKACLLPHPMSVDSSPLVFANTEPPQPGPGQVLIQVGACGICRTDLHVVEGELPVRKSPVIPGHQIVGKVVGGGSNVTHLQIGDRVGVAWLHRTCGVCRFCVSRRENLCVKADFTGYTVDGGYAEYTIADEKFVYKLPEGMTDLEVAPLLCAGIIGFRCLRVTGLAKGQKLGLYGFGAAAHIAIQIARYWGLEVYVCSREQRHCDLALELGAKWAGTQPDSVPVALDGSIIFAPAGELVPPALRALDRGGVLTLGGIHMSDIPSFPYDILYYERVVRSVCNNTRQDGEDFLDTAQKAGVKTHIEVFPLADANRALYALKHDGIQGAAGLSVWS